MPITVTHATVAAGTDAGNGEIAKAQWNEAHTIEGLGTAAEANIEDFATAEQGALSETALQSLVGDTTPQLGGNLDLNGNEITGTGNIDIIGELDVGDVGGSIPSALPNSAARIGADINGVSGVYYRNKNAGSSADFRFLLSDNGGTNYVFLGHSSTANTGNLYGKPRNTLSLLSASGRNLLMGTASAHDVIFGTSNTEKARITSGGDMGIGEQIPNYKLDVNGSFGFTPGASVTPVDNGDVVFELTDNTTLTIKAKGADGTVRSATITLA